MPLPTTTSRFLLVGNILTNAQKVCTRPRTRSAKGTDAVPASMPGVPVVGRSLEKAAVGLRGGDARSGPRREDHPAGPWMRRRLRPLARKTGRGFTLRASDDPAGLVVPVAVAQQALVELAGRQARQLRVEIDRARHFLARQMPAAKGDQLLRDLRRR